MKSENLKRAVSLSRLLEMKQVAISDTTIGNMRAEIIGIISGYFAFEKIPDNIEQKIAELVEMVTAKVNEQIKEIEKEIETL